MRTSTLTRRSLRRKLRHFNQTETGATLIEMAVAMVILMVGLLSLVAAVGWGLNTSHQLRNMSNTKMTVTSMLEQMETLRNTRRLTFGQIANVGDVNNVGASQPFTGFVTGFQGVSVNPGPDSIYGTADDLIDDGVDNIYGTGDDFVNTTLARKSFARRIVITSLSTNLKRIEVTMRYPGHGGYGPMQELVGVSYLNNDANSNFR